MRLLVTGGAGYIGSHVTRQLVEAGHQVVVLDNLSTGFRQAVLGADLVVGDLADTDLLDGLFARYGFDAALHFAAFIVVPESIEEPIKYFRNNTQNVLNLLEVGVRHRLGKVIFSSTAAVYGEPDCPGGLISEAQPLSPINPYGASKMMSERLIQDVAAATGLDYVILRYFNVAGADPGGRIGQSTPNATHLIKVAAQAALGMRSQLQVFGTDYATPDGTCVRDYIHVEDLAAAHLAALDYLDAGGGSQILNCGYGHGLSVREVVDTMRAVSGVNFPVLEAPRRAGDPPALVADNARILATLGWRPRYDDIETIVASALKWEAQLRAGHWS